MTNKRIAVECLANEQKTEAIKYARPKSGNPSYPGTDTVGKYIIISTNESKSMLGTHNSGGYTSKYNYNIISYDEFERDYLFKKKIGEYYSYGYWIFIHVDPVNYQGNHAIFTDEEREEYYNGNCAIKCVNDHKNAKLATPEERQWLDACIKAEKFVSKEEALKSKDMKFKIGDIVKFKTVNIYIPSYGVNHDGIPEILIKHGSTEYLKNEGKIENIHDKWYIVSYIDIKGRTVRLGFEEDKLELLEKPNENVILKVGDWMVILEEREEEDNIGTSCKTGTVFQVEKIEDSNILPSKRWLFGPNGITIGSGGCRKAIPDEIPSIYNNDQWTPVTDNAKVNWSTTHNGMLLISAPEEWCVKLTSNNKGKILDYFKRYYNEVYLGGGSFYGVKKKYMRMPHCSNLQWGVLLSDEEFDRVILNDIYRIGIDPVNDLDIPPAIKVDQNRIGMAKENRMSIDTGCKVYFPLNSLDLIKSKERRLLDTDISNINSVNVKLVKPNKLVLF